MKEKKMDKTKLFYKYTDWQTLQNIGIGWVAQIHSYVPFGGWITESAAYQIGLWALNIHWIPYWAIFVILAVKFYVMMVVNWIVGKFVIKIGLFKAQQQYTSKSEHLSPYEKQHRDTLINIAKAVGAKSEYDAL